MASQRLFLRWLEGGQAPAEVGSAERGDRVTTTSLAAAQLEQTVLKASSLTVSGVCLTFAQEKTVSEAPEQLCVGVGASLEPPRPCMILNVIIGRSLPDASFAQKLQPGRRHGDWCVFTLLAAPRPGSPQLLRASRLPLGGRAVGDLSSIHVRCGAWHRSLKPCQPGKAPRLRPGAGDHSSAGAGVTAARRAPTPPPRDSLPSHPWSVPPQPPGRGHSSSLSSYTSSGQDSVLAPAPGFSTARRGRRNGGFWKALCCQRS